MSVLITGASGFVGQNMIAYFKQKQVNFLPVSLRQQEVALATEVMSVVHLAGKAHDLKKVSGEEAYFEINTELTKRVYDAFCQSKADTFIYLSSVKAVADNPSGTVDEETTPNPITAYGKSKLAAEKYLISNQKPGTRLYILRPCMIHGPYNKGNLNMLYHVVKKGIPYPLGSFSNQRSYLSVDNLCFIIHEMIKNRAIPSGIYHVADDETFSTNELVQLVGESMGKKAKVFMVPKGIIYQIAKIGDKIGLPLTTERLHKLTESYVVSNKKIITAINKALPLSGVEGLLKTFSSFNE
jgi:nucleoside-diphosphate-sugar epimerase